MTILIIFIVSYILLSVSLYLLFPKADVAAVKGLIPGVNFVEWCKIIGRPSWWAALLLIPIVNIFIFAGMAVNMMRSFKKYKLSHSAASVLYTPAAFFWLSKNNAQYDGPNYPKEKEYLMELRAAQKAGDKKNRRKTYKEKPILQVSR